MRKRFKIIPALVCISSTPKMASCHRPKAKGAVLLRSMLAGVFQVTFSALQSRDVLKINFMLITLRILPDSVRHRATSSEDRDASKLCDKFGKFTGWATKAPTSERFSRERQLSNEGEVQYINTAGEPSAKVGGLIRQPIQHQPHQLSCLCHVGRLAGDTPRTPHSTSQRQESLKVCNQSTPILVGWESAGFVCYPVIFRHAIMSAMAAKLGYKP
jgi:hypothetical protein